MSLTPTVTARAHWQTTPAWRASLFLATTMVVLGALFHRFDLAALSSPFLVHVLRSVVGRPRDAEWTLDQSAHHIVEGQSVNVEVACPGATGVLTLGWTPAALLRLAPAHGVVSGTATAGVRVEPLRWGRHLTGPAVARIDDPSGAWRAQTTLDRVVVRVRPAASRMVGGSGVKSPLGLNGAHLSSVRGEGTEIAELREYRPGDRMRRIAWRVSSRTEDLHVVDSLTERETDVLVVLDTQHPAQELGMVPDSSLDIAIRATMALTQHYLDFGDRVGVHDLGRRVGGMPLRSGPHQARVLNELVSRAVRGEAAGKLALNPTPRPRSGALVFVCSPLLDEDVITEIGRLRNLGSELVVIDTLPSSLSAAGLPRGTMLSAQTAQDSNLVAAWSLRRMRRDAVVDELRAHGVPVTAWHGPTSLAAVLLAMEQADRAPRLVRR